MEKQIYFNAPIELYQHFIENTWQCLDNVLDYCIAEFNTESEAEEALGIKIHNWVRAKMNGTELRKGHYNGTEFSIPIEIFFDYYENHNYKKQRQKEMILGYLALKSMGNRWPIFRSNNSFMFARMAGYPSTKQLPDRVKLGLIAECNTPDKLARVRKDIMNNFFTVHIYSEKGKRGFCVMFTHKSENLTRNECFVQMAKYMEIATQKYKDKLLNEQLDEARKQAKIETETKKEKQQRYFKNLNINR